MTYPDPRVAAMLDGFVCIRVDVDQQASLAKQYGAKAMPDLRLLDADGKERRQLLGFSSPERLLAAGTQLLDELAGRRPAGAATSAPVRRVEPTPAAIAAAIDKGGAFLLAQTERPAEQGIAGLAEAELLGLAVAGKADGDRVGRLLHTVLLAELTGTYQAGFEAMALARIDKQAHRERLAACAAFLQKAQLADGSWSYGADAAASGDHSNSAYALLGLDACVRAGVAVDAALIARAEANWRGTQNRDGGFGYRQDRETDSYASMTSSGISSLLLCRRMRDKAAGRDDAVDRAVAWLGAHASAEQNTGSAYQQGRLLYHLYALERAGSLLAVDKFGQLDWYAAGAAFLLGTQRDDGSWDDGADMPAANTVFALLFLTRATRGN